jgi:RNA-directed DNA polymerase
MFDIETKAQLAKLLAVGPWEIDEVLTHRHRYYRSFKREKEDGTFRTLRAAQGPLKLLQAKVKTHILDLVRLPDCVHGGVRGRSVITNAIPHLRKQVVFCLDVKDFFPSVDARRVRSTFEGLGFSSDVAQLLTDITAWENQLPQGAATSSGLANLAMTRVDVRLQSLANQHGFSYTRYVDDLTLSGSERILDFRRLIQRVVLEEGFLIRQEKLRTMHSGMRQVVAGIVVNRKPNLTREQRLLIRRELLDFRQSRGRVRVLGAGLRGKLSWLSHVNPELGSRLSNRVGTPGN